MILRVLPANRAGLTESAVKHALKGLDGPYPNWCLDKGIGEIVVLVAHRSALPALLADLIADTARAHAAAEETTPEASMVTTASGQLNAPRSPAPREAA